jgi:16S rRNA (uracil1498-N3)-methyltransferase
VSQPRLFIEAERFGKNVIIEPAERRYLVDVLRLGPGDQIEVFDGRGGVCRATLLHSGKVWSLKMERRQVRLDSCMPSRLAIALTKGKKQDLVIRMVTELGISAIEPFVSSRSVSRPKPSRSAGRLERWHTIAIEAARQSGRTTLPEICPVKTLEELLLNRKEALRVILHQTAKGKSFEQLIQSAAESKRLILVGPEGGFSSDEVEMAQKAGFIAARFGLPVLRAETAAIVAAAFACLDRRPAVL